MATYAFAGGVATVPAYGQRDKVKFAGTWVAGDTWTVLFTATVSGDFTLGKGNIAGQTMASCFKLRNRMYMAIGNSFALSSNGDVTLWEEQDPGAAVVSYLSQFGPQDTVIGFASMQGRLAVIGNQTIQIWSIDADPAAFALQQVLDSSGALSKDSIKSIGDLDVLFLDKSGIRSLRAKESTLNAFVNDIGTAIDLLIRADLVSVSGATACGIVEPTTRQYWLFLNTNIYVLSYYPESKIVAWSTYKPTIETAIVSVGNVYTTVIGGIYYWTKAAGGISLTCGTTVLTSSGGFVATFTLASEAGTTGTLVRVDTAFTPERFVVFNRQVYVRTSAGKILQYGGSDGNTYDHCRATVELPWIVVDKNPEKSKQYTGLDVAWTGNWKLEGAVMPRATSYVTVIDRGSGTAPSMVTDSTFDIGHYTFSGHGTHLKLKATSGIYATGAKLGQIGVQYNVGTTK